MRTHVKALLAASSHRDMFACFSCVRSQRAAALWITCCCCCGASSRLSYHLSYQIRALLLLLLICLFMPVKVTQKWQSRLQLSLCAAFRTFTEILCAQKHSHTWQPIDTNPSMQTLCIGSWLAHTACSNWNAEHPQLCVTTTFPPAQF